MPSGLSIPVQHHHVLAAGQQDPTITHLHTRRILTSVEFRGCQGAYVTIVGIYWLLRTKNGLALAAVRDNTEAAKSVGVDAARMKWVVFLVSAFGTGLAGGLIYMQKARISPDAAFSVTDWTAYVIFIVVIGGIGTIEGPILGVLIFFLLQSQFADFGSWYLMILGLIGIAIMLFAPRGLWGLISERTGIQLFPIRRRVTGGKLTKKET